MSSDVRKIITIDGLASTGKTSAARLLSERLGFAYLNSGLLYRAVGALCLSQGVDPDDEAATDEMLDGRKLELLWKDGPYIAIDGEAYAGDLQAPEVSEATSRSARHPLIRARLLDLQRQAYPGHSLVAEGRDMGTVVFPDAELKFFLTVSTDAKLARRVEQLSEERNLSEDELKSLKDKMKIEIEERDERDSTRAQSPTVAAEDALCLDNSSEKLTSLVEKMYNTALSRGLS